MPFLTIIQGACIQEKGADWISVRTGALLGFNLPYFYPFLLGSAGRRVLSQRPSWEQQPADSGAGWALGPCHSHTPSPWKSPFRGCSLFDLTQLTQQKCPVPGASVRSHCGQEKEKTSCRMRGNICLKHIR